MVYGALVVLECYWSGWRLQPLQSFKGTEELASEKESPLAIPDAMPR
jgi:hypothetical protein